MIEVIHRSHGIHETVLHELCRQQGLYEAAGVDVMLRDGTGARWATASVSPAAATVAVGGVVADWLRGDRAWIVHFVATVKPMMWVVGTGGGDSVHDLPGRRIAAPNLNQMPSLFLRLMLERHGYDIATDVEVVEVSDRPDRLRLLESGQVDASLLGPEGLGLGASGLEPLVYVGDHIEFPTVGFAARPGLRLEVASTIATAMGVGLERLRSDEAAAVTAMRAVDPQVPQDVVRTVFRDVIGPDWGGQAWAVSGALGDVPALARLLEVELESTETRRFLHGWTVP